MAKKWKEKRDAKLAALAAKPPRVVHPEDSVTVQGPNSDPVPVTPAKTGGSDSEHA